MLIYILLALVAIVALFLIVVALRPGDFRVARTGIIAAPPEAVFPHVNDLHNWKAWSPWAKLDPNATETHEGSPAGTGAIMRWSGNNKVGQGSMTIVQSRPSEFIQFRLEFLKPFKCTNAAEFTFTGNGNQTTVTWTMTGNSNFVGKAFRLFMSMDKMVGGDFEKGLAAMKTVVEAGK